MVVLDLVLLAELVPDDFKALTMMRLLRTAKFRQASSAQPCPALRRSGTLVQGAGPVMSSAHMQSVTKATTLFATWNPL